jgi:lysophospholipid acyltransferase (LPLAT)-like uncharacterized protein
MRCIIRRLFSQIQNVVDDWQMKIHSPHLLSAGAALFAWSMRALFQTVKIRFDVYEGTNPFAPSTSQSYIYAVWHDSAVMAIFAAKHLPDRMATLTSWHRDGDFAAKVVQTVGIRPVRGSTGKRGERALREMIRIVERSHVTVLPDGPRGPRRKISRGMVFLASRTGTSIVPGSFVCTNPWQIQGSWTELQIPKPFSTVVVRSSKPIHVPPHLTRDELDNYVQIVQQAMDQLEPPKLSSSATAKAA